MSITKKLRFEIFKRDGFQCQYCGRQPPEIVLELDHILPRKRKGKDDTENLITACFDCNRGKGSTSLKIAPAAVGKRLEELKEKEAQLREFYKYQKKIQQLIEREIDGINELWSQFENYEHELSKLGRLQIKNLLRKFSRVEIEEAIVIAFAKPYLKDHFAYMCGVLWTKKRQREEGCQTE